eukprot:5995431-Prymnesium_polylepis.1
MSSATRRAAAGTAPTATTARAIATPSSTGRTTAARSPSPRAGYPVSSGRTRRPTRTRRRT